VGPCVLEDEIRGRHPDYGEHDIAYRGRTFLVQLAPAEVGRLDPGAVERAGYLGHRWWSLHALERTNEEIWPAELAAILHRVAAARHI